MKLLIVGDLHYTTGNRIDTAAVETAVFALIEQHKPQQVVLLGDILDTHERYHTDPHGDSINFLKQLRAALKAYGGQLAVLIGNHDRPNNSDYLSGRHPFTAFESTNEFAVVSTPMIITVPNCSRRVVCVPYVPPGRFAEAVATVSVLPTDLIVAHQEFKGAKMGAIVSEAGDDWPLDRNEVISGHVHDYQRLQPNVLYVGTPYQQRFGETDGKTVSLFELEAPSVIDSEQRLALPGLKPKKIMRFSASEVSTIQLPVGYRLKIVVIGTQGELNAVKKNPRYLEWRNNPDYKVTTKTIAVVPNNLAELITDEVPTLAKTKLSFIETLRQRVAADPQLAEKVNLLFPAKPVN